MRTHSSPKESASPAARPFFSRLFDSTPVATPFFVPNPAVATPNVQAETEQREPEEQIQMKESAGADLDFPAAAPPPLDEPPGELVQTKLTISSPGDRFEREADVVADSVVQRMESGDIRRGHPPAVQAKCTACQGKEEQLQRQVEPGHEDELVQAKAETTAEVSPNGMKPAFDGSDGGKPHDLALREKLERPLRRNNSGAPVHPANVAAPLPVQRLAEPPAGKRQAASASVDQALASPGQPLEPALRQDMEQHFGYDFSQVRVHIDMVADRSARDMNAHAYTIGRDIAFRQGLYQPNTVSGKQLLAHELTHVVQQSYSRNTLRRKLEDPPPETKTFAVKIPPGTTSVDEFRRYAETIIFGRVVNKQWEPNPAAAEVYADISNNIGKVIGFRVPMDEIAAYGSVSAADKAAADKAYSALNAGEREKINEEIDRRYYTRENVEPGTKIQAGETGKAAIWSSIRREVLADKNKIDALPQNIKKFLFDEKAFSSLDPKDFETVLRISSKVAALTAAELTEYKSRVTAKTTDWTVYESSIDRFLAERKDRESTAKERRTIETRLYGLESLYQRYRDLLSEFKREQSLAAVAGTDIQTIGASPTLIKMRDDLNADLIKAGFPGGITDFDKFIRDYEKVFERETLAIARVMLDQYEHLLWTQEQRYQKPVEGEALAEALYQAVSQTKARAEYEQAEKIRSEHAQTPWTPEEMAEQAYWVGQRNQALARGETQVRSAAAGHPLVSNPDFDRERLARASKSEEVQSLMLSYIAARKKDIAETRKNLKDKPSMIYGLDTLLKASFQAQNIQSGTIYEKIIRNRISDIHWTEAISQIVLAVIAVAAGLLTGGGGTVAVLAAGTALGIGAYQAVEEFRRYEMKSAAYGAKLTSDDPTMAWVIVAVIGAGIDVGAFASVLPKLRPAIQAFNVGAEAGDVAKLTQKLDKLTDVEEGIRKSIIRAAEAEAEARAAWKAVFKPPAALRAVIIPGAEEFGRFVYAVYLSFKRGIREFQVFVKTNEAIKLIGDVTKLTDEEMAALKTGYLTAIEEMETVAAHGKALGMVDNEIRGFMNLRGNTKGMTVEQVTKEMDAWKATRESGVPFGFQSVEQFEKFQSVAATELKRLLKKVDPNAEAFLQGSAISGISYKRHLPFDVASDLDIAISSRSLMKQAEKLEYEVKLSPRRIGPLDPDQIAELGLHRFEERLGGVIAEEAKAAGAAGAATPRKINIMLFDTAEAVKKPIGAASAEAERAAIPLKVEK